MRIRVAHETIYRYAPPAKATIQLLRLTPRNHTGQYVYNWRVGVDRDARLKSTEDHFGNVVHTLTAEGPIDELVLSVEGEVETEDTAGVVGGTIERFPPPVFLRETSLTRPDSAIRELAAEVDRRDPVERLHTLMLSIAARIRYDIGLTDAATPAATALARGHGVCQDHAHVFIAAARGLGFPARYVSGHLFREDGRTFQEAGHAWAEAYVPDLGWVGFDPSNGVSPTDAYVRIAVGLDYLEAAPVRGTRYGGGEESLEVRITVDQAH
jgi:transglutaminase-like putative cysteine protease